LCEEIFAFGKVGGEGRGWGWGRGKDVERGKGKGVYSEEMDVWARINE
jgi:hypothetical protein